MNRLVAVNKKEHQVVVEYGSQFITIDTEANDVVDVKSFFVLNPNKNWVKPASPNIPRKWNDLAISTLASFEVLDAPDAPSYKIFRVPEKVQGTHPLVASGKVSMGELVSLHDSASFNSVPPELSAWVSKIVANNPTSSKGINPSIEFFGTSSEFGTLDGIFAKTQEGEFQRLNSEGQWEVTDELPGNHFPLDAETVLSATTGRTELNEEELALTASAISELDFEFLDRVFDIYDSYERSANAQKQVRGPGGKFVPKGGGGSATPVASETLARLPQPLPLVEDVNALIDEYLAQVGQSDAPAEDTKPPKKAPASSEEMAVTADQVPQTQAEPLYIAIVDSIAADAVLEVVALVPPAPGVEGDVSSWVRRNGQWVAEPNIIRALRGSTPPPIVHLKDPDILKTVIEQVDFATKNDEVEETPVPGQTPVDAEGNPEEEPLIQEAPTKSQIQQGFALANGTFLILNADQLSASVEKAQRPEEVLHVSKRAFALNRMDLIPASWRKSPVSTQNLIGPYGELVAAGGADRNRGNAEKLRRYWTRGVGGAKIGWGTPRDWTRCVAYLSKYLGARAKGYCSLRHREMVGYYPGDRRNK